MLCTKKSKQLLIRNVAVKEKQIYNNKGGINIRLYQDWFTGYIVHTAHSIIFMIVLAKRLILVISMTQLFIMTLKNIKNPDSIQENSLDQKEEINLWLERD